MAEILKCEKCGQKNRVDISRLAQSMCAKCGCPLFIRPAPGRDLIGDLANKLEAAAKNERFRRTQEYIYRSRN